MLRRAKSAQRLVPPCGDIFPTREASATPSIPSKESIATFNVYQILLRVHGVETAALQGASLEDLQVLAQLINVSSKGESLRHIVPLNSLTILPTSMVTPSWFHGRGPERRLGTSTTCFHTNFGDTINQRSRERGCPPPRASPSLTLATSLLPYFILQRMIDTSTSLAY